MKKTLLIALTCLFIASCSNSDDSYNGNPYLVNYTFDTGGLINTNLPQFNKLIHPNNYIVLGSPYGINGTVLYFSGSSYTAFEISDPNHALQSCSKLTVEGVIATCDCSDANQYDILTGQPQLGTAGQYALKPYRVEANGNIIRVYN